MEQHQKNKTANDKILNYVGKMFRYPKDFDSLLYVSQLIQAKGSATASNTGAAITAGAWCPLLATERLLAGRQLVGNRLFPALEGASLPSKKFFARACSIFETGTTASIHLTNDTLVPVAGVVEWKLIDFEGASLEKGSWPATVAAQSASEIGAVDFTLTKAQKFSTVLVVRFLSEGGVAAENQVSFVPDKHLKLTAPEMACVIRERADHYEIHLTALRYAKFVELTLADADVVFSDNYSIFFRTNRDHHRSHNG